MNILLVNVTANVNAPGTHCFSEESAASCCPGRGVVIAILLFCQNHHRRHHSYLQIQFIEEEIEQPEEHCLQTKKQLSQSVTSSIINVHRQEYPHLHPDLSIIAHHGGHDANAAL